jgi:ribosomal protein S18 acetylase RimI-like enzyme
MSGDPADESQIVLLRHADEPVSRQVRDLVELASIQESRLVGVAPTIPDIAAIQASAHVHLGAMSKDGTLLGLLCLGADDEADQLAIHTLVVRPASQRRGIARRLVQHALARLPTMRFAVVAAEANLPALALYRQLGFEPYRSGLMSGTQMPVFKLRRMAHREACASPAGPP